MFYFVTIKHGSFQKSLWNFIFLLLDSKCQYIPTHPAQPGRIVG